MLWGRVTGYFNLAEKRVRVEGEAKESYEKKLGEYKWTYHVGGIGGWILSIPFIVIAVVDFVEGELSGSLGTLVRVYILLYYLLFLVVYFSLLYIYINFYLSVYEFPLYKKY
jgi:hypothetical protein